MKLYHYTHEDALPSILAEGLTKGDIPVSPTTGRNGVWFTTDPNPEGHGVYSGGTHCVVTAETAWMYRLPDGTPVPVGTPLHFADKQKIRIRVEFETSKTPLLYKWLDLAKEAKIDRDWLRNLHAAAGDDPKPHTWWLWLGVMPPEYFQAVEVRSPDGYVSILERPDLLDEHVREIVVAARHGVGTEAIVSSDWCDQTARSAALLPRVQTKPRARPKPRDAARSRLNQLLSAAPQYGSVPACLRRA
jgi:hypothetical protein